MESKKTLVMGATPDSSRYAYIATRMLADYHHEVVPFGIKKGEINGLKILNEPPQATDFDTVTLYLGPQNQPQYYDYIIGLKPKRVIFNPGTENEAFGQQLTANGIEPVEACTLVMLRTGQY
jgi:predicted CoA-binding protein